MEIFREDIIYGQEENIVKKIVSLLETAALFFMAFPMTAWAAEGSAESISPAFCIPFAGLLLCVAVLDVYKRQLQGLYAIGSGGLFGQGLGQSIQKLGFLPESQNDMIFAIICEELGLFGAVSIILIFLFMIFRFMVIANNAPDLFGALLVVGVMGHIAIQVVLNIAVVTLSLIHI